MSATTSEKRAAFRALHESGCFVIPNPWDVGSAIALQSLGFSAIASTSAGMAWSMGRADTKVGLEPVLAHLAALAAAVDIPLNADFENAFADGPGGVAANVARAMATGVAGLSVEDSTGDPAAPLYDFALAVERVAAARAAIDAAGGDVVLTARSEGFIAGRPDMDETLRRLTAYAAAGADCLYAPGLRGEDQIGQVVRALAPKPVNVLSPGLPVATLAALGVRRISVGGALARAAWGEFLRAAREIAEAGAFTALARGAPGGELNALFAARTPTG
jgi:methylisocitrate lyase